MEMKNEYFNLVTSQVVEKTDKNEEDEERRLISAKELKSTVSVNPEDDDKVRIE